ncbi:MAG: alpha-L-fucosidase [Pirellulales bacterium]|nr:alpha-L-fucosidase [Pirellulales bacterium]
MRFRSTTAWLLATVFAVSSLTFLASARAGDVPPLEERARWFHHDRFGMFIHWGIYSQIGKGEWVQLRARIPKQEYIKLRPTFNPEGFDAAEWVALAKRAGQKYIVITTKHHDGFCMFDSKLTDYTIMNTPLSRDICKELAEECKKQDMKLGFYYSILDWHHPDYVPLPGWDRKDRSAKDAKFDRYVDYMKGQIRELMTNYGPIVTLWFDGNWHHKNPADKKAFKDIVDMARELQPNILVNDRAGIGGDYKTPEQQIPATGVLNDDGTLAMWEVCMTMTTGHGSFRPTAWWGYDKNETKFKPVEELLHKLVDVASKGGNFLLNVGPEPTGRIRPEETQRLEAVGRWMDQYSESIYGTTASPFRLLPFFGRATQKGNRLYIHVFDWPEDGKLVLPGLRNAPAKASILGHPNAKVETRHRVGSGDHDVLLTVPKQASDPTDSVIVLDFDEPPMVEPLVLKPRAGGKLELPASYVEIRARHGQAAKPMSEKGRTYVGNWSNPRDVPTWCFTMPKAGTYKVKLDARVASEAAVGQRVIVRVTPQKGNSQVIDAGVALDGSSKTPAGKTQPDQQKTPAGKKQLVGKITKNGVMMEGRLAVPAGKQELSVQLPDAKMTGPPIIDLFGVTLIPE